MHGPSLRDHQSYESSEITRLRALLLTIEAERIAVLENRLFDLYAQLGLQPGDRLPLAEMNAAYLWADLGDAAETEEIARLRTLVFAAERRRLARIEVRIAPLRSWLIHSDEWAWSFETDVQRIRATLPAVADDSAASTEIQHLRKLLLAPYHRRIADLEAQLIVLQQYCAERQMRDAQLARAATEAPDRLTVLPDEAMADSAISLITIEEIADVPFSEEAADQAGIDVDRAAVLIDVEPLIDSEVAADCSDDPTEVLLAQPSAGLATDRPVASGDDGDVALEAAMPEAETPIAAETNEDHSLSEPAAAEGAHAGAVAEPTTQPRQAMPGSLAAQTQHHDWEALDELKRERDAILSGSHPDAVVDDLEKLRAILLVPARQHITYLESQIQMLRQEVDDSDIDYAVQERKPEAVSAAAPSSFELPDATLDSTEALLWHLLLHPPEAGALPTGTPHPAANQAHGPDTGRHSSESPAQQPADGSAKNRRERLVLRVTELEAEITSLQQQLDDTDRLIHLLSPVIGMVIAERVRESRDEVAEALYPVIGKTIGKAVAEALRDLIRTVDRTFQAGLRSPSMLKRLQLRLRGIQSPEALLRSLLPFQVHEIFLIHKDSGLLIEHVSNTNTLTDADLIAGMLTAIRSYVQESFAQNDGSLDSISYGDLRIFIEEGTAALLAVVVEGHEPVGFQNRMRVQLTELHIAYGALLRVFTGDPIDSRKTLPFLQPLMESIDDTTESVPDR
ncbi:MAG: hypothetical protein HC837_20245 [Chloroflexaceae bacterium]|nr:hypothetical protein [Chloroflexaceae bacterium]